MNENIPGDPNDDDPNNEKYSHFYGNFSASVEMGYWDR
jgi:hypothetical protein